MVVPEFGGLSYKHERCGADGFIAPPPIFAGLYARQARSFPTKHRYDLGKYPRGGALFQKEHSAAPAVPIWESHRQSGIAFRYSSHGKTGRSQRSRIAPLGNAAQHCCLIAAIVQNRRTAGKASRGPGTGRMQHPVRARLGHFRV